MPREIIIIEFSDFQGDKISVSRTHHGVNVVGKNVVSVIGMPPDCNCDWCSMMKIRIASRTGMRLEGFQPLSIDTRK